MADAKQYKDQIDALGKVLAALADLEQDGQTWVLQSCIARLGLNVKVGDESPNGSSAGGNPPSPDSASGARRVDPSATPKQFMDKKHPNTDVERVACLAFYLAHFRETAHFKTADITAMNTQAAQPPLSNTSVAVGNAQKARLVTDAGKRGQKQLTSLGEKIVNALPSREEVKTIMDGEKKRGVRRRKKSAKKKAATK